MSIQKWSDDIMLIDLPEQPAVLDELQATIDTVSYDLGSSVVLDFSNVNMINSSCIAKLLTLRKILAEHERTLVLCGMAPRILHVFRMTGLIDVFRFSQNKLTALTSLRILNEQHKKVFSPNFD